MSDDIDITELTTLAADIASVPTRSGPYFRAALDKSSVDVKESWSSKLVGSATIPAGSRAISYDIGDDINATGTYLRSDIGPTLDRTQGAVVGLTETGSPRTPPRGYGTAALAETAPDFERGIERATDDALKAAGL